MDRRGKTEVLEDPGLEDAAEFLRTGLSGHGLVVVVGACEVEYSGRASSYLGGGERVLMVKPDGSLLVHQNRSSDPVNWQPPGSSTEVKLEDDVLVVESRSNAPPEVLTAWFTDVHAATACRLVDGVDLEIRQKERDMQERIERDPSVVEEGFRVVETERESSYGRIDVFGRDSEGRPVIVELKRKQVGAETVDQLGRYVEDYRGRGYDDVRGILAAPGLSDGGQARIEDRDLEYLELEPVDRSPERETTLDEF